MSFPALSAAVATAARSAGAATHADVTEGELLRTYARSRAEAPFADLVRRLGPMVLGVCRRVAGDRHLADDAFQAAFAVLARRAGDVRPAEAVRAWLYGVAVRTAREARAVSARRLVREVPMPAVPDRAHESIHERDADALAILDQEIADLPEHLRSAVVICELDGMSRKDAAKRLGVVEGTLSSRLAKAQAPGREAAEAGRFSPGGGAGGPGTRHGLAPAGRANLRARLIHRATIPAVAALTHGALRIMYFQKLTVGIAFGLVLAAAYAAAQFAVPIAVAQDPPKPPVLLVLRESPSEGKKAPPAAKPVGQGRLLVWKETQHVFLTPDGREDGTLPNHPDKRIVRDLTLSPDGTRVALVSQDDPPTDNQGHQRYHIFVRTTDGKGDGKSIAVNAMNVCWTEDGKSLIAAEYVPPDDARTGGIPHWTIDPATGEKTRLDVPKSAHVFAVMPDGKAFVAALYDFDSKKVHLALVSRDGKDMTRLCELHTEGSNPRPSPDGARILFQDYDHPSEKPEKDMPRLQRLYVYDLKAKTRARLEEVPLNALLRGYAWSPDAKRIAYIWKQVQPGVPLTYGIDINDPEKNLNPKAQTETESHLVVCDATGKNPKTLLTVKAPSAPQVTIEGVDWR